MLFFMAVDTAVAHEKIHQKGIDEKLFSRIGKGDMRAFEELYRLSERSVYAFALSLVKNPHDAVDVVQDTYLKVRAAAHLYQPQGKPLAWMFTIARNLSRNMLRNKSKNLSSDELSIDDDIDYSYISDPTDKLVLSAALKLLEDGEREIILLHVVSGLKHREIAADLGVPIATVLSRYHRGLKKLKKHLAQGGIQHE